MKTKTKRRTKKLANQNKRAAIVQVKPAPERPWILNESEVAIVKNNIAKGCSDEELKFCLTVARRYRMDPFKKQIWFVKRWDKGADDGRGGNGGFVWTPQVGINGLLFAAARDHNQTFGSVSLPEYGPMLKVGNVNAPEWARVKVWKKGEPEPTEAQAWWTEYAPYDLSKAPFWQKMPRRMIAKCATALAIRQAYPDLGGLYIPEEMERMSEQVTPNGRRIIDPAHAEIREITDSEIQEYDKQQSRIMATPWKENRLALSGPGLQSLKSEIPPDVLEELGIVQNVKEKVTHISAANYFKLKDRAEKCKIEVTMWDQPTNSLSRERDGDMAQQRLAATPSRI
jgi:hypothetical protein